MYSFVGGGLPAHVRTLAIGTFENNTPQPRLLGETLQHLQRELPRSLGVRLSSVSTADAVLRGKLVSFVDQASVTETGGQGDRFRIPQRQVQLTFEAEIYDLKNDRVIWKGNSITVSGRYGEAQEPIAGMDEAVRQMAQKIIEGAQSQW